MIAVIVAVLAVVAIATYYIRSHRHKYLIRTAASPDEYVAYVTDSSTFHKATSTPEPSKHDTLLESQTMQMQSKEDTMQIQVIIGTNEAAVEKGAQGKEENDVGEMSELLKSDEDTHL